MPLGTVKWFNRSKGYGFIAPDKGGGKGDIFVHFSAIDMPGFRALEEGQRVIFDIEQGPKGLLARNVSVVQTKPDRRTRENIKTSEKNENWEYLLKKILEDPRDNNTKDARPSRQYHRHISQPEGLFESPLSKKPYRWQSKAIEAWEKAKRRGIVEAVTGSGKTFVALAIAKRVIDEGGKCLVIVRSITLFRQWKDELEKEANGEIRSLIGAENGFNFDPNEKITLAVVNSVVIHRHRQKHRRKFSSNFDLVIADECHHFGAPKFSKALLPQAKMRLGLTATLERSDDGVDEFISPYFAPAKGRKAVVFDYGFKQAIQDKVVSNFVAITLSTALSLHERSEYEKYGQDMQKARERLVYEHGFPADGKKFYSELRKGHHTKDAGILIGKFNKCLSDRRKILGGSEGKIQAAEKLSDLISASEGALVYCADIGTCNYIAMVLELSGVEAEAYHTKIDEKRRERIIHRFRDKDLKCVVAVNMLDEGIDIPHANLAVILSSSQQKRQLIQRLGRVLRKKHEDSGAALVICYAQDTKEDPHRQSEENDSGKIGVLNLATYIHEIDGDGIDTDRILALLRKYVGWKD